MKLECEWEGCQNRVGAIFNGRQLCVPHIKHAMKSLHHSRLQAILQEMNVPEDKKTDLRWLDKNIHKTNESHPKLNEAYQILKTLQK